MVFWTAAVLSALFVAWGILFTDNLAAVFDAVLFNFLVPNFGWVFILSTFGFLTFSFYLAFSRYGRIRLGGQNEQPEFRTVSWVAMMFSAGMGIGLMFYGVAEPISHMGAPPFGLAEPNTKGAAQVAMEYSYFHWAFHPWAIYAIMGLALAYFCFRKGMPNLISSAFYPLIGERVYGPIGKSIDVFAIWATLFGSATSLGFGAAQINSGLNFLWDVPVSSGLEIGVIGILTLLFVLSAVSGVEKGVQFLSNVNMVLAIVLALFVLFVGPFVFIWETFTESVGAYLYQFIPMSFRSGAFGGGEWLSSWTIFYWAWWISWTPFVGTFLARISKGRTIREYLLGVLLVPTGVTFVWFAIFGGAAINLQLTGQANLIDAAAKPEVSLFSLLEQLPLTTITSALVIFLVALFFISGADAASVVMGMLSSRGNLEPSRAVVVMWGTLTGLAAIVLLLAGGLTALQNAAIIAAAPFVFIIVGMVVGMLKEMRREPVQATLPARAPVGVQPGFAPQAPTALGPDTPTG